MNLDEDADISDEEIRKILAEADTGGTGGPPLSVKPRPPKHPPPAELLKERDVMRQKEKAEMASGEETAKLSGPQGRKKNLTQLQSRLCAAWQQWQVFAIEGQIDTKGIQATDRWWNRQELMALREWRAWAARMSRQQKHMLLMKPKVVPIVIPCRIHRLLNYVDLFLTISWTYQFS